MPKKKTPTLNPDAPRQQWIRCRVNESEAATVATWLAGIDADSAEAVAVEVAERLATRAPFATPAALIRAVFDLVEVSPGAPAGNQNHTGKRGANASTKKASK